jgi:hypothetical protein
VPWTRRGVTDSAWPAVGHDNARPPPWRPPAGRGPDCLHGQAALGQQPGDHRVGVPHLARPQLVAAPDRAGQAANQLQQATGLERIVAEELRAGDRLVGVGDAPVAPAADLVAEHPPAAHPVAGHRALDEHAARWAVAIGDRPAVLDDVAARWHADHQRGVVEVQRSPVLQARVDGLPDAPVEAHEPAAGTQGEPVQLDAGGCARWRQQTRRARGPEASGGAGHEPPPSLSCPWRRWASAA